MTELWENPMGTDGFEFVEYTAPDVGQLHKLFEQMGFRAVARHRSKDVTLYRQGETNFIVNAEKGSHGARFAEAHGPSACAMGFRVKDAAAAYKRLIELGAKPFENHVGPMELNIPAIEGIGGSVIYLVDRYGDRSIYDVDFVPTDPSLGFAHEGAGLTYIDHVTHNVFRGNMDKWAGFYEKLFNFREIRYFDIEGKLTGLKSRAMTSPCGKIRIPINESSDDKSQIAEYLARLQGRGHPAHRAGHRRHLRHGRDAARQGRCLPGHAGHLLRTPRQPHQGPWRGCRSPEEGAHPDGRRADRGSGPAAADLHPERDRPDLLRDHPAQGQ